MSSVHPKKIVSIVHNMHENFFSMLLNKYDIFDVSVHSKHVSYFFFFLAINTKIGCIMYFA